METHSDPTTLGQSHHPQELQQSLQPPHPESQPQSGHHSVGNPTTSLLQQVEHIFIYI
jgi:hypothetical protein